MMNWMTWASKLIIKTCFSRRRNIVTWLIIGISSQAEILLLKQVGGWTQVYKGLTLVTVRGAGHEVPLHRPKQALVLFKSFLSGSPMPTISSVDDSWAWQSPSLLQACSHFKLAWHPVWRQCNKNFDHFLVDVFTFYSYGLSKETQEKGKYVSSLAASTVLL